MLATLLWIIMFASGILIIEEAVVYGDIDPRVRVAGHRGEVILVWFISCVCGIYVFRAQMIFFLVWILLYACCSLGYRVTLIFSLLWVRLVVYTRTVGRVSTLICLLWILLSAYSVVVLLYARYRIMVLQEIGVFFSWPKERAKALARGYTPLQSERKEIRLLVLFPGDEDSILECELEIVSLDQHPPFEALSYTWDRTDFGEQPSLRFILVDGKERTVPKGLSIALKHLQYADAWRILWIDALCIDQGNIHERNEQVKLMGSIYGSATRVLVWLGPADTAECDDPLMQVNRAHDPTPAERQVNQAMQLIRAVNEMREPTPDDVERHMRAFPYAVLWIFRHRWWSRVWVIQELAMAKSDPLVGCGHEWVPWSYLVNAFATFEQIYVRNSEGEISGLFLYLLSHNLLVLNRIRQSQILPTEEVSLEWYLRNASRFHATDDRDKVYALLGLARERDRAHLVPDYGPAQSVLTLYPKVVRHFIDVDGSLNILSFFRGLIEGTRGWPTWVPHFETKVVDEKHPAPFINSESVCYNVSGALKAKAQISESLSTLSATGILFDVVSLKEGPNSNPFTFLEHLKKVNLLFTSALASRSTDKSDTRYLLDRSESHWRTMVADTSSPTGYLTNNVYNPLRNSTTPADESFGTMYDVLLNDRPVPAGFVPPSPIPNDEPRSLMEQYIEPFWHACHLIMKGRSAFTTRCGFAGLGQPEVEQGDLVVILFGADVPFILRPKDSHYTFIGDCYVHGIMQGELIDLIYRDGEKLNGPELREFKIR